MKPQASPLKVSGESTYWQRFRLDAAILSAPGAGRPINDDACVFAAPGSDEAEQASAGYLFAVVDGDSAKDNGGRAARETATSLLEILEDPRRQELRPDLLLHRLQDSNDRCERFIHGRCSATAVWIWEESGQSGLSAGWSHVGDTRLYLHDGRQWRQLSRDHAKGPLLDRAVGQGAGLVVDSGRVDLKPGNRIVLASRGVWRTAPIASVLGKTPLPPTAESVRQLVGQARLNGSRDDTSAIAISVATIGADAEPEH